MFKKRRQSSVWNKTFHFMKQDYGMLFFACLLDLCQTTHIKVCQLQYFSFFPPEFWGQFYTVWLRYVLDMPNIQTCESNNIQIGIFVLPFKCITPHGHIKSFCISSSWFIYFLSRQTSASWQIMMLTVHKAVFPSLATKMQMVCILRVYIAQTMRGKNSMCHKKYQNPVSHLRFGTHPHITSMIYINS